MQHRRSPEPYRGKRLLDLLIAIPAVVVLSPVFAIISIAIALRLNRPILFRQVRPGKDGKPFTMVKFRTMRDAHDQHGRLLPDAERITPLGQFLRSTSLDELPELINVLKGEMSIVGPRPLLMHYLDLYTPQQARRHEVRPGITGWAQVHGRNALTWDERFRQDVWYVEHASLLLDLRIIALTVWKILKREGVNEPGMATMSEFTGSVRHPE